MFKIGMLAFTTAVALAGVSYAGEQVALVCTGTGYLMDGAGKSHEMPISPTGLMIDVDGGKVIWADDTLPITSNKGNFISFQGDTAPPEQGSIGGTIDRVSGGLTMLEQSSGGVEASYVLHCLPAKPVF
jgi:hypothetical protein